MLVVGVHFVSIRFIEISCSLLMFLINLVCVFQLNLFYASIMVPMHNNFILTPYILYELRI